MIISVLNQKGGVGKTTLSLHIASTLALEGHSVLVIDADTQRSSLDWAASRENNPIISVVGISTPSIHKEVELLKAKYDYIIIDGPPRVYNVARSTIAASDFVIIPVQPSPYDIWSAKEIVDLIDDVKTTLSAHKKIGAAFVINRKIPNTVISRDVVDALSQYKLKVLSTTISQRVSFAECAANGSTVIEDDPHSLAAKEIKALTDEIIAEINKMHEVKDGKENY